MSNFFTDLMVALFIIFAGFGAYGSFSVIIAIATRTQLKFNPFDIPIFWILALIFLNLFALQSDEVTSS